MALKFTTSTIIYNIEKKVKYVLLRPINIMYMYGKVVKVVVVPGMFYIMCLPSSNLVAGIFHIPGV